MTAAAADALTVLGVLIVVIGGTFTYWHVRDQLERRALRRWREAEAADERQRQLREARARYVTDEPGRPE